MGRTPDAATPRQQQQLPYCRRRLRGTTTLAETTLPIDDEAAHCLRERQEEYVDITNTLLLSPFRNEKYNDSSWKSRTTSSSSSQPPLLLRSGSSGIEEDEEEESTLLEVDYNACYCDESTGTIAVSTAGQFKVGDVLLHFVETVQHAVRVQVSGLSTEFCDNGMPWSSIEQCRSMTAGLTGILYAMPSFFVLGPAAPAGSSDNATLLLLERTAWIVTACFSVWADYFHIHRPSVAHGVDRIWATAMLLATIWRGGTLLAWWSPFVGAALPVTCFVLASRAKKRLKLRSWHYWHCGWHVTGAIIASFVVYSIHRCGGNTTPESAIAGASALLCR